MAQNADRPNGLIATGTLTGAPWNGNLRVLTADTTEDLFRGDGLEMLTAGTVEQLDNGTASGFLGTFVGLTGVELRSDSAGEHPGFWDFSVVPSADALICYAQGGTVYEIQESGLTTPLILADIGGGITVLGGSVGSTTTGISGMELDSNTGVSNTVTEPLNLLRLVNRPNNELSSVSSNATPNARWLVVGLNIQFSAHAAVLA